MKYKFNVGDRVVCTEYPDGDPSPVGMAGVVENTPEGHRDGYYDVLLDEPLGPQNMVLFAENELRPE